MQYTIEQLKTQLAIMEQRVAHEQALWKEATSKDYAPAIEYGEQIRMNHLKMINMRRSSYSRMVLELKFQIEDMDNE